jgi:hypothetical protein
MSQYEERFLPPAPSLHQTFAAAAGRGEKRWRRRIWAAAAEAGALAIICTVGSHRAVRGWIISHRRATAARGQILAGTVSQDFKPFP